VAEPVDEDRDEQIVLAFEVAVERLVREPALLDDVGDPRVDAVRPADDLGTGAQEAFDLVDARAVLRVERSLHTPVHVRADLVVAPGFHPSHRVTARAFSP
jgi:hypothetical protein